MAARSSNSRTSSTRRNISFSMWTTGIIGTSSASHFPLFFDWSSRAFNPLYNESITKVDVTSFSIKNCFTTTFNIESDFSLDICCLRFLSILDQKLQKLK
ncbi:hypothetical protein HanRHA438_Chr00c21g0852331 [Helianthus annuus]|nr:hypothetical protein HanRHA438_Chr00c21g0852331 [Helianthus annuus]